MHSKFHIQSQKVNGFVRQKFTYEAPGEGDHDPHATADMILAKRIGEVLQRHYPDHPWLVEVDHRNGVAFISLPIIMRRNQRFVIHTDTLKSDPGMRSVVRAGGEILERHNIPRAGFTLDRFLEAREASPNNRRVPRFIIEN